MIDDRELRLTAAGWLHQLKRTNPTVALACSYINDTPNLALLVEVRITSAGPVSTAVILDRTNDPEQQVIYRNNIDPIP
jgi:hypothetical protein